MAHLGLCWPILALSSKFGVWPVAFGGWGKKMVMLGKITKMWKNKENARNFAKYWTVLHTGGSKIWGCAAAGGQNGLHGSIQLAQNRPNIGPT